MAAWTALAAVALALAISTALSAPLATPKPPVLPIVKIDKNTITLSGVSSGAYMAVQTHVSFSQSIMGVGVFAGGPYWCAKDLVSTALHACMGHPNDINDTELIAATDYAAALHSIDDPKTGLRNSRVWMLSGTKDTVVDPGVVKKTNEYYDHWVAAESLHFNGEIPSEHGWVTDTYGNECASLGPPYIQNCGFDAAGSMLQFLFQNELANRTQANPSSLFQFGQQHYTPLGVNPHDMSLGDVGYIYVPEACKDGAKLCKLHIAFHGCEMDLQSIGEAFVVHAGLNEWAEANDMVVVYPQAQKSPVLPYNPKGCWDWWGYTAPSYATKLGPQIDVINHILGNLTTNAA